MTWHELPLGSAACFQRNFSEVKVFQIRLPNSSDFDLARTTDSRERIGICASTYLLTRNKTVTNICNDPVYKDLQRELLYNRLVLLIKR